MRRSEFKRRERSGRRETINFPFLGLRKWFFLCVLCELCVKNSLGRAHSPLRHREHKVMHYYFLCALRGFVVKKSLGRACVTVWHRKNISGTRLLRAADSLNFSEFSVLSAAKNLWDAPVSQCGTGGKSLGSNRHAGCLRSGKFSGTRFVSQCVTV